ncbi:MAG: AAA family ATPase [Candidatus Omnitrophica bacterium]|nr:AAA family ATPase [Candidatus Omnitrophota bacterium]
MKKIFIAATKQNDGKTTVSLGLIFNFRERYERIGFIKPIGQRYLEEDGLKVDEDSLLVEEVCGIHCGLKDMSPIAVERGFTEEYILHPSPRILSGRIMRSFKRVCKDKDFVVIEGTGHAGVGAVFDHSNAAVARLLGSKVIIISSGGIGRPVDEVVLNKALFEREGVEVLGVIVNKVLPEKLDRIKPLVERGLKRKGLRLLGVIPYNPVLSYSTLRQIVEETDFEVLCGQGYLENSVSRVIVGAMEPHDAIRYIVKGSLLITPGDREDIIMAALGCWQRKGGRKLKISGIILTGGILPARSIVRLLDDMNIPVLLSRDDTYNVVAVVHDLTVKIRPQDRTKIQTVIKLVKDNVDLNGIMKGI